MIENYNKIIQYKNIEYTILYYLNNESKIPLQHEEIIDEIKKNFIKNKENIMNTSSELSQKTPETINIQLFDMKNCLNYEKLHNRLLNLINKN